MLEKKSLAVSSNRIDTYINKSRCSTRYIGEHQWSVVVHRKITMRVQIKSCLSPHSSFQRVLISRGSTICRCLMPPATMNGVTPSMIVGATGEGVWGESDPNVGEVARVSDGEVEPDPATLVSKLGEIGDEEGVDEANVPSCRTRVRANGPTEGPRGGMVDVECSPRILASLSAPECWCM
jgi:hypothetical protein